MGHLQSPTLVFGPTMVFPIINQPQVAILGIGKAEKKPVIIDDMIAVRTKAFMTLAFDHRLLMARMLISL